MQYFFKLPQRVIQHFPPKYVRIISWNYYFPKFLKVFQWQTSLTSLQGLQYYSPLILFSLLQAVCVHFSISKQNVPGNRTNPLGGNALPVPVWPQQLSTPGSRHSSATALGCRPIPAPFPADQPHHIHRCQRASTPIHNTKDLPEGFLWQEKV